MYDSFHRIIAKHQRKVMKLESRKKPLIRICEHHFFFQTNVAVEIAMQLSCDARVNMVRVKPKSLSSAEVAMILNHVSIQITSPRGIQKQMLYYIVTYFVICENNECYKLNYKDFTIGTNQARATCIT